MQHMSYNIQSYFILNNISLKKKITICMHSLKLFIKGNRTLQVALIMMNLKFMLR